MKFNEFEADAIRQHYRRKGLSEEQIDEIIPAIAAAGGIAARAAGSAALRGGAALAKGAARAGAKALARGAAGVAGAAAKGIATGAAKGIAKSAAKGIAKSAAKSIGGRSRNNNDNNRDDQEPEDNTVSKSTTGTQPTRPTQPTSTSNNNNIKKKLRPGQTIKMPAGNTGKPTDFKVTGQQGKDVRVQNPRPMPGEPKEFVFNKDELEQALKNMQ
jgi:hypothetical protein